MASGVGTFTILEGSSGDLAITGLGFAPTQLQVTAGPLTPIGVDDSTSTRVGVSGKAGEQSSDLEAVGPNLAAGGQIEVIHFVDNGALPILVAVVISFDADGFTIRLTLNTAGFDLKCLFVASNNI